VSLAFDCYCTPPSTQENHVPGTDVLRQSSSLEHWHVHPPFATTWQQHHATSLLQVVVPVHVPMQRRVLTPTPYAADAAIMITPTIVPTSR
jgi:hypothetical protein